MAVSVIATGVNAAWLMRCKPHILPTSSQTIYSSSLCTIAVHFTNQVIVAAQEFHKVVVAMLKS